MVFDFFFFFLFLLRDSVNTLLVPGRITQSFLVVVGMATKERVTYALRLALRIPSKKAVD